MKTIYKRLLIGLVLIGCIIALRISGIGSSINLAFIQSHKEYLNQMVQAHYFFSAALYIFLYALIVTCSIPITIVLTIASGFFFGALPGALYSVCGSTAGATASFIIFRYFLRGFVKERYGKSLQKFNNELRKNGASYVLSLVLLPITPFGVITILSGLSDISVISFIVAIAVGTIPGCLIYAFAGKQLMNLKTVSDIWSLPFILSLLFLVILSLLPVIIRFFKPKKTSALH